MYKEYFIYFLLSHGSGQNSHPSQKVSSLHWRCGHIIYSPDHFSLLLSSNDFSCLFMETLFNPTWSKLLSCFQSAPRSPSGTTSLKVRPADSSHSRLVVKRYLARPLEHHPLPTSQVLTWWRPSGWRRRRTPRWRAWLPSRLSSTASPPTSCTRTPSWPRAPGGGSSHSAWTFLLHSCPHWWYEMKRYNIICIWYNMKQYDVRYNVW